MKPQALLTTIPSDSHNWNLIYMQLLLQENDFDVHNLGACTPYQDTLDTCLRIKPDLVIVSTVNGHGYIEGVELIGQLRTLEEMKDTEIYIGGKLSTDKNMSYLYAMELEMAGFTKAYYDNTDIQDFVRRLQCFQKVNC